MAWRENQRRNSNGSQYMALVSAASHHPASRKWKGYWQRRAAKWLLLIETWEAA
jgi:hypothetical protein